MTDMLENYLGGQRQAGTGTGTTLADPVTGESLVRVSSEGLDIAAGFQFARQQAGPALQAMTYAERSACLDKTVAVLKANRDAYYDIATANSGTTKNDSAIDIDGGIYTVGRYAKWGRELDGRSLLDGRRSALAQDGSFASQHVLVPVSGLALFINAFNFPAWGLWEKAAPALLSGVPIVVKPATTTAWLTQRMVADVVAADIWPKGTLSVICGRPDGLLDALQAGDVLSFTGSGDTANVLRRHPAITERGVRMNVEADSLNSAILLPGATPDGDAFNLLTREVCREMTQKSGQKCTAIRRVFVPEPVLDATLDALAARLKKTTVGNPRNDAVRMGSLVNRSQYEAVRHGLDTLAAETDTVTDGRDGPLIDADPAIAACIGPTLFAVRKAADAEGAQHVHSTEVFGPVATVLAYRDMPQAQAMVRRGGGSLVASLYGDDAPALAQAALGLAAWHGRVHVITPDAAKVQTGHGNVMPQSLHGGPGRAGGGQELGGLRALAFYHQRTAIQAAPAVLDALQAVPISF